MEKCNTCRKKGTMECPNSSLCWCTEQKPFWEPVKYKGREVSLFCPSCDLKFGEGDQIRVERGLKLCPNCMVELKSINNISNSLKTALNSIYGKKPDFIIYDEFASAQDTERYEIDRAFEYVAKNASKNGDEDTLDVCIISDLLRIIRDHNM